MKNTRLISVLLVCVLLLGLLAGCGAASSDQAMPDQQNAGAEIDPEQPALGGDELEDIPNSDRKLVRTVRIDAETETYDALQQELDRQIAALGGYVETRDTHLGSPRYDDGSRSVEMKIRIPADKLNAFVEQVSAHANVLDMSENTEDITLQYVDTEARIRALEAEQARLMELLSTAESLEAVLQIEQRLGEVNYELDRHQSQKRTYDNQVDYATVYLSVWEVHQLTPMEEPSVWTRISEGLQRSLRNLGRDLTDFFVWFIVELPYILVVCAIAAGAVWLGRRLGRRRKISKANRPKNDTEKSE